MCDIAVPQADRTDVPQKILPIEEMSPLVYTWWSAIIIFQYKNYLSIGIYTKMAAARFMSDVLQINVLQASFRAGKKKPA